MKKCLIIVDYQNDFVDGSLGFTRAIDLEYPIANKIDEYRKNGDDVIFTLDTHGENYMQTREGRFLPIEHCIKGSNGHKLYGAVGKRLLEGDKCFFKPSFGSDELYEYLKDSNYSSIELVGVVTNICVISNAILAKTACPEIDIIVDASCVASNDNAINEKALDVMEGLQIKIINRNGGENNE